MSDTPVYFKSRFASLRAVTPGSRAYSNKMAWLMAEMAHLAYEKFEQEPDLVARPLARAGFTLVNRYNGRRRGTQAFLAVRRQRDLAILCYRGTNDVRDWLQNIDMDRDAGPFGGKIHDGFWTAFRTVERRIAADLATLEGVPVYITGHSLGGALATLASYFFPRNQTLSNVPFRACYTFGGPRVGNRGFASVMRDGPRLHRVVREGDVVPGVPLGLRFKHAGDLYFLDKNDRLTKDVPVAGRFRALVRGVLNDFGKKGLAFLKAHDHQAYADQLGEYGLRRLR